MTTSTAYSRDLGDELRRLRETYTPFNGHALAINLGWDPSKVSNIEHGKVRANEIDLIQYITACGKNIDFYDDFCRRYRNAFDQSVVRAPDNVRTLAITESSAEKFLSYDVMTAPVLLQTRDYAHELLAATGFEAAEDIGQYVTRRMERQTVLRRPNRPGCLFYVHELALQLRLGDARLMRDQYAILLANASLIRIVPAHLHTAALQSKCVLYEFERAAPVVYTETDAAQVFTQDSAAVERTRKLFQRLDSIALDEHQSERKLAQYAGERVH